MYDLNIAIVNSGESKQFFAERVKIRYSRIANILYGTENLTKRETKKIKACYGNHIFLKTTTQNVY